MTKQFQSLKAGSFDRRTQVQFTARLPYETHRKLRFLAADQNISLNEALNRYLLAAMEGARVSLPKSLQDPEPPE